MEFTALHRALGLPPGPISNDMLDQAIEQGVRETDDLDWKARLPDSGSLSAGDFPKDIAAMANSGGGIIVYGVKESGKAATERVDVTDFGERRESGLRAVAVSAISPPVFGLRIYELGEEPNRAVAVVIPATEDGPHLVYRNDLFGAPVRNDADTAWMKERQIETMYRARFEARRAAGDDLQGLYQEAKDVVAPDVGHRAWFVGVARPRTLATPLIRPTRQQATDTLNKVRQLAPRIAANGRGGLHPLESLDVYNPRPGLRRWDIEMEDKSGAANWHETHASIHDNGVVMFTAALGAHRDETGGWAMPWVVNTLTLECAMADILALVREHGRTVGASEYDVRIRVEYEDDQVNPLTFDMPSSGGGSTWSNQVSRYAPITAMIQADAEANDFQRFAYEFVTDAVNQAGSREPRLVAEPEGD